MHGLPSQPRSRQDEVKWKVIIINEVRTGTDPKGVDGVASHTP